MSPRTVRSWLRWTHITLGLMIAAWAYTPLIADQFATEVVRFLLIPFLAISGLAMWQQMGLGR